SGAHQLFHGIDAVEPVLPKAFVIPCVFTDRNGDRLAFHGDEPLMGRGCKITLLVENIVEGQQHLRLHELNAPVAQQGGRVHDVLAGSAMRGRDVATDDSGLSIRRARSNLLNGLSSASDKGGLLQQVGGRVAADGEFRKEHETGSALRGPLSEFKNLAGVPVEVADGGIDLGERDLHSYKFSN